MTPIVFLMKRLSRLPLHERIFLLRTYMKYEKPNSIRWKELNVYFVREMVKQLARETREDLVQGNTASASAPNGHPAAERVLA